MAKLQTLNLTARAEAGATLVIRDFAADVGEDGTQPALKAADGSDVTITLLGIDSPAAKRVLRQREASQVTRAYTASMAGKKAGSVIITADEIAKQQADQVDLLVALTVGWHGFEDEDDTPLPCTEDHVRALYEACDPIRQQVANFVYDRRAFFGASRTPSAPSLSITSN